MTRVFDPGERIQAKRHYERLQGWTATLFAAVALSILFAVFLEVALLLVGPAFGTIDWQRAWIDVRFTKTTEWLQGVPVLGIVFGGISRLKDWFPANSFARDIFVLGITAYPPALWAAGRVGPALVARYDGETLYPNPPQTLGMRWAGPLGDHQRTAWAQLREWCLGGAGPGNSAWWRPHAIPHISKRFSVALLTGVNGVGKTHLVEALRDDLNGSRQLATCGSWLARCWLLLRRQILPCVWWRESQPNDTWDVGYLLDDPAASTRLSQFRPRRPTLIIADERQPGRLRSCIDDLASHRADFRHPVRLLLIEVAVPMELGLTWDWDNACWRTAMCDDGWGAIAVVDLSGVQFGVPEFRGLVGAQSTVEASENLVMSGEDTEWVRVVDELDHQPILIAEAIRYVREEGASLERLKSETGLTNRMVQRQRRRDTPLAAEDAYGQTHPLLRERVLSARAEHREATIRSQLGPEPDVRYRAVMIATLANGASAGALQMQMGWEEDQLGAERLSLVFGALASSKWVPPCRPAVLADELLRRHFGASWGTELSQDKQAQVTKALRSAWIINPAGTLSTCARWASSHRRDAFAALMLSPPGVSDLAEADLSGPVRVNVVRAFFELATLHDGEVSAALAAMAALTETELLSLERALDGLFSHPSLRGLPALILWFRLMQRRWAPIQQLPEDQAVAIATSWVQRVERLVRQATLFYVDPRPLDDALTSAASAALPHLARLARPAAADDTFLSAVASTVARFDEFPRIGDGTLWRLATQVSVWVAVRLAREDQPCSGEPTNWVANVLDLIRPVDANEGSELQLPTWAYQSPTVSRPDPYPGESIAWGKARSLRLFAGFFCRQENAVATEAAAERVALIAREFPHHEGIQSENAAAWYLLAWAQWDRNVVATEAAVEKVALIARDFPRHEGLQHQSAAAWRLLAWTHQGQDAVATEAAAEKVALIAREFPRHECIQSASAEAWSLLAWALEGHNAVATEAAAAKIVLIAREFPRHEGIQCRSAQAWCQVAHAHSDHDTVATEAAAAKVAPIAREFPRHEGIQYLSAQAWLYVARAHSDHDAVATEAAAAKVALIAREFPRHEEIQCLSAEAWSILARAHSNYVADIYGAAKATNAAQTIKPTNAAQATEAAAGKVVLIARDFPRHEGIQCQSAQAWLYVAHAHCDYDAVATAAAAAKVALIAREFPRHEGIQHASAEAWHFLAWAHEGHNAVASEAAAAKVDLIAREFPRHEDIQHQNAQAWCRIAWAYKDHDPVATEAAAAKVALIARDFPRHEGIISANAYAWRILAWAHKDRDAVATEAAAAKVALIAREFPRHEEIQCQSAQAWYYVASAHKDQDPAATEAAAAKVALIAREFPRHEGIQCQSAWAWRLLVRSGVKFDNHAAIAQGLTALDAMIGVSTFTSRGAVSQRVIRAREEALAIVTAWRAQTRGKH